MQFSIVQGNLIPQGELKGHEPIIATMVWNTVQGNLIPQGELKVNEKFKKFFEAEGVQGNLIPQGELKDTPDQDQDPQDEMSKEI